MRLIQQFVVVALGLGLGLSACKKEKEVTEPVTGGPSTGTTDKLKDSALLYSRDIYLWYKQIPGTFNPQSYKDLNEIMTALRKHSNEPGYTAPVDRWSFAVKQDDWDNISSGISGDFGLNVFFFGASDLRVKSVEAASPAGKAGIRRGWKITKLNGSTNISTANVNPVVEAIFNSTSTNFTFEKPDGTTVDLNLKAATYQEQPIALDSVYTAGSRKVGYLVFNSFLGDTTQIYNGFQRIFNRFASEGVQDVVVDLRYNGGGYVTVQNKLANYLAPSSANGSVMMTQQYNDKYSDYNSQVKFSKLGSLNLNRIFFVVSQSTASASELLINNLKPFMDVKVVGPNNSYGKPVGYFPIPVGDWYIFPVSFRTVNKNGEGSYYTGFAPDSKSADGLDKDWGDVNEASFATALKYITTGSFRVQGVSAYRVNPEVEGGNQVLDKPNFKGAIGVERRLK